MKVVVGSTNPIKIKAVESIFSKIYSKKQLEVTGIKVDSGISAQPFNEEAIKGAINRAKEVMLITNIDLSVGIEAGLFKFPSTISNYLDMHWCAILDRKRRLTTGCSSGFELPPDAIYQIFKKGKEVGEVMDEIAGMNDVGKGMGAIGMLSKGIMNRMHLNEQAVLMAMIPRINEQDYFVTG